MDLYVPSFELHAFLQLYSGLSRIVLIGKPRFLKAAAELTSLPSLHAQRTTRRRMLGGLDAQDLHTSFPARLQLWAARAC